MRLLPPFAAISLLYLLLCLVVRNRIQELHNLVKHKQSKLWSYKRMYIFAWQENWPIQSISRIVWFNQKIYAFQLIGLFHRFPQKTHRKSSSEIGGLCLMKWPSKILQNLPCFYHRQTHVYFFISCTLFFPLMNAMVYVDIDQGIH